MVGQGCLMRNVKITSDEELEKQFWKPGLSLRNQAYFSFFFYTNSLPNVSEGNSNWYVWWGQEAWIPFTRGQEYGAFSANLSPPRTHSPLPSHRCHTAAGSETGAVLVCPGSASISARWWTGPMISPSCPWDSSETGSFLLCSSFSRKSHPWLNGLPVDPTALSLPVQGLCSTVDLLWAENMCSRVSWG